jgi:hypothetical protein
MSPILAYLIIAVLLVLALAGFTFRRTWSAKRHPGVGCASTGFLVLGLFGILSQVNMIIWDGGYLDAEYQLTFQDPNGQPIEAIELRVEDRLGHSYYHYPVTDFLPDQVPTSDSNGLMMFHHVSEATEFGGRCWLLFCFIPVEEHPAPEYVCRFLYRGQEIYQVQYHELNSWREGNRDEVEKVKRRWKRPDWPASQILQMQIQSNNDMYNARVRKFFDLDGDGKLNSEEGAAYQEGTNWRNEEAAIARLKGEDPEEEIEFPIVRRTLTIRSYSQ